MIEEKIRNLRKQNNRARLKTDRDNGTRKRQKMEDTTYITIRDVWGPPPTMAPKKEKKEREPEDENTKVHKRQKIEISDNNNHQTEDREYEKEEITEFEVDTTDWDAAIKEHREKIIMLDLNCILVFHFNFIDEG